MGYVSVQGGITAIENAEQLAQYMRLRGRGVPISVKQIEDQLRLLVDRVMGEGGLYSPFHAALAIKQAEGDPIEASFYLRAYRSTLPRLADTLSINTEEMRIIRRISSAFKDIPGGQVLGPTSDYLQRILDFTLIEENTVSIQDFLDSFENQRPEDKQLDSSRFKKVIEILRQQGLVKQVEQSERSPVMDVTQDSVAYPVHRSARLQMLARAETGGILALAYSSMRGYGSIHPTIAELRAGFVTLEIPHPYRREATIKLGSIQITEVDIVAQFATEGNEDKPAFTLGYGICFGNNELKAISMAVLDRTMKEAEAKAPAQDQEFVLMHTDGIESSGFCAHFKLPHYITFQSDLDCLRGVQDRQKIEREQGEEG